MSSKKLDVQIHKVSSSLGQAIRQCRRALDLPIHEFAKKIRKTPKYVSALERAEIAITTEVLQDCAIALGLSVGELIDIALSGRVLLLTVEDQAGSVLEMNRKRSLK